MGEDILKSIKKESNPYVLIDLNPDTVKKLIERRIPCIYGDTTDPDILETVNIEQAKIVISVISHFEDNEFLLNYLKKVNPKAISIVEGETATEAVELYRLGADYVVIPRFLGGHHASLVLEDITRKGIKDVIHIKNKHLEFLNGFKVNHKKHKKNNHKK